MTTAARKTRLSLQARAWLILLAGGAAWLAMAIGFLGWFALGWLFVVCLPLLLLGGALAIALIELCQTMAGSLKDD